MEKKNNDFFQVFSRQIMMITIIIATTQNVSRQKSNLKSQFLYSIQPYLSSLQFLQSSKKREDSDLIHKKRKKKNHLNFVTHHLSLDFLDFRLAFFFISINLLYQLPSKMKKKNPLDLA